MAIANWTCVSWVAYAPGTIAVYVTWIEREFNACQTPRSMYPIYLQPFLKYSIADPGGGVGGPHWPASCQSQLVTKITNIQAVHTETYCTQYIYMKRQKTVYMGYIYNWATRNNDRGRACQKRLLTGGSILLRQWRGLATICLNSRESCFSRRLINISKYLPELPDGWWWWS